MVIHYKNGTTREVTQEIVKIINDRIIQGCGKFQTFSNEEDEVLFIVNLEEIVQITRN